MDRLMMKHTVRRALLLACAPLLLGGCPLFRDPAAPPFADRIEAVQSLTEYGVVPALRDRPEMRVINTGVREFLLVDAPVEDGRLLLVLNQDLSLADTSFDLEGLRGAFPIAYDEGFVVGKRRFESDGTSVAAPDVFGTDGPLQDAEAAFGGTAGITRLGFPDTAGTSTMRFGPVYESANNFQNPGPDVFDWTVLLVPGPEEGDPPEPLFGFSLVTFTNMPTPDFTTSSVGLVLRNDRRIWAGSLTVSEVSQILGTIAGTPVQIEGTQYDYLLELPSFVELDSPSVSDRFVVTPEVVVSAGYDLHEVFSRESGERIARRSVPREEYISYAYSPTGRHLYMLDTIRWRVYRVSRWW